MYFVFLLLATSQEDEVLPSLCCVGCSAVHHHNHRGLSQGLIWLRFSQVKAFTQVFYHTVRWLEYSLRS